MPDSSSRSRNIQLTGPFDSLRDYVVALEARGRLLRIKEMDQDQFETTGFAHRLVEKFGITGAPAFLVEKVKINGQWIKGPVISNLFGGYDTEAMGFGVEDITDDQSEMYRSAVAVLVDRADANGEWPRHKPIVTTEKHAPCKQVKIVGDNIDILQYPWLKCNPADGGRYINCGAVITEDPEFGRNVGTYRCQVKSKTKIGVNPEPSKDGWRQLMAARKRGEKVMKAAVVLGADPITWAMSCAKIARLGEDEYELAGGLRGKPVEVIKCETSDILVPANAEMIIEGEIPLDQEEEEGPHAEMFGYLGHKRDANFFMNVKAVTHRRDPMFINVHTGVTRGFHTSPLEASAFLKYKKTIPNIVAFHSLDGAMGIMVVSIKKRAAGDGLAVGQQVAATNRVAKVTIVVDDDVDVLNTRQVMHAVGSRWQPHPATLVIPHAWGSVIDPSAAKPGVISKIVIDATRQYPEEGGPASWPPVSRQLLEDGCPQVFDLVDRNWPDYWATFRK